MNVLLERTLDVDLCRRYRDLRIASVEQFKEEAVILREDKAIVTFLIKEDGKAFLGYADTMKEMQLIPLDDAVMSALITAYGSKKFN